MANIDFKQLEQLNELLNQVDIDATVLAAIANDSELSVENGPGPGLVTTRLGATVKNVRKLLSDLENGFEVRTAIQYEGVEILPGPDAINVIGDAVTVADEGDNVVSLTIDANVIKEGVPEDNQLGVWTGDGTIEGDEKLTWDGNTLSVIGNVVVSGTVNGRNMVADGAKLDSIDLSSLGTMTGAEIATALDTELGSNDWALPASSILIDEDDMVSDSDEHAPTQQSVKAFVENSLNDLGSFRPTTVTGPTYSLDIGEFNFFDGGLVNTDVSLSFVNVPTEAAWTWSAEIERPSSLNGLVLELETSIFNYAGQDTDVRAFTFNDDGTRLFLVGNLDRVYQYNLSTAYDLASALYGGFALNIASQTSQPEGIVFNNDGLRMFVLSRSPNARVLQYNLGTPYTSNTATYSGNFFDVGIQDANPRTLRFNDDGTRMYIFGTDSQSVHQYNLLSAYDLSTAAFDSSVNVSGEVTDGVAFNFNNSGSRMFVLDADQDAIVQYSLNSLYEISTATFDNVSFEVVDTDTGALDFGFNDGTTKFYVLGSEFPRIHQFEVVPPTPITVTLPGSVSNADSVVLNNISEYPIDNRLTLEFFTLDNGTTVYLFENNKRIARSTGGDISASDAFVPKSVSGLTHILDITNYNYFDGGTVNQDITLDFIDVPQEARWTWSAKIETPIGSGFPATSYTGKSASVAAQDSFPYHFYFDNTGFKMYMVGTTTRDIFQYSLGIAWDISTAIYNNVKLFVGNRDSFPTAVVFDSSGSKMYVLGRTTKTVYQYSLSTVWDISTATYDNVSFNVSSQDGTPVDIKFDPTGTIMYIVGFGSDSVYQYSLGTAWEISTVSYSGVNFNAASQDSSIYSVTFNNSGDEMFIAGDQNNSIYRYTLGTAWDVSTASYTSESVSTSSQDSLVISIFYTEDNNTMFALGYDSDIALQYNVPSAIPVNITLPANVDNASVVELFPENYPVDDQLTLEFVTIDNGATVHLIENNKNTSSSDSLTGSEIVSAINTTLGSTLWQGSNQGSSGLSINTVSGINQVLDVGEYNFFDAGTVNFDVTLSFSNVPTEAAWTWTAGLETPTTDILTNATYDSSTFDPQINNSLAGLFFNDNKSIVYYVHSTNRTIISHTLSVPGDISTASSTPNIFDLSNEISVAIGFGFTFNEYGTKLYVISGTSGTVRADVLQYSLSTAWDISTASYDSISVNLSAQDNVLGRLQFNPDGTKLYALGLVSDRVYQYSLSTPYDLSSISYDNINFNIPNSSTVDFLIVDSGKSFWYVTATGSSSQIFQFDFGTPWDLTTLTNNSISLDIFTRFPFGGYIYTDETLEKLYIGSRNDSVIHQYSLPPIQPINITLPSSVQNASVLQIFEKNYPVDNQLTLDFFTTNGGTTVTLNENNFEPDADSASFDVNEIITAIDNQLGNTSWKTQESVFKPNSVTGVTQTLDVGEYNFFSGGIVDQDTTLTFNNIPQTASWKWSATINQIPLSSPVNFPVIVLPASVNNASNVDTNTFAGIANGQQLILEFFTIDGGTNVKLIRRDLI